MRPVRDNFVERIRVLPTDGSHSIVAARVSGAGSSAGTVPAQTSAYPVAADYDSGTDSATDIAAALHAAKEEFVARWPL